MKSLFTLSFLCLSFLSFSQAPEKMSYQAVIRDASDNLVTNQSIITQISILQGSLTGTSVYTESQMLLTNQNGLLTMEIGTGLTSSPPFSSIDWSNGPYYLKTETTISGSSNTISGTTQLLSVPYSLYAKTAYTVINDSVNDADSDPTNELQALSISNDTLFLSNGGFVTLPTAGSNSGILSSSMTSTTTSSISFVDMIGMTNTFNSGNSPVMIHASIPGTYNSSTGAVGHFRLLIDGVQKDLVITQYVNSSDVKQINLMTIDSLSPGQHTVSVQWRALSGTLSASWNSCTRQILIWQ